MTTVAIMQPTYLPWLGYFDMLDQADVFVLLDTVAVSPKSWQMRNHIRARDGSVVWLSVPTNARRGMPLTEVRIDNSKAWQDKHWLAMEAVYGHAPHFAWIEEMRWRLAGENLYLLTEHLIEWVAYRMGIETRIEAASDLGLPTRADPIHRIADICSAVGAQELLNTPGAKDFLDGHDIGIPIRWHDYTHPTYSQGDAPFVSHLSVVDLLAWHGPKALDIIRSGRNVRLHGDAEVCSWDVPRLGLGEEEAEAV